MKQSHPHIFILVLATACLIGCGAPGIPLPPSLELPKPVTDLRATRKADKVTLSWTTPTETTDGQTIRHLSSLQICRSVDAVIKECGTPIGKVSVFPVPQPASVRGKRGRGKNVSPAAKVQAHYVDTIPSDLQKENPTWQITYAVVVPNDRGRTAGLSNQVQVPAAPTLPPPARLQTQVTADGIAVNWTSSPEGQEVGHLRYVYRIYRREDGSAAGIAIGEVPVDIAPLQLVDHTFEWEKTYNYRVTVVTVISPPGKPQTEVEGEDSRETKVVAHDVFPPAVPSGLEAVASGVGQPPFVDLIWAPNTDADLAGYNIFRHEEGTQPVKINSEPVKTPAFRDTTAVGGKKYFYSVTAVDLRGNESARSEAASESVPGPNQEPK